LKDQCHARDGREASHARDGIGAENGRKGRKKSVEDGAGGAAKGPSVCMDSAVSTEEGTPKAEAGEGRHRREKKECVIVRETGIGHMGKGICEMMALVKSFDIRGSECKVFHSSIQSRTGRAKRRKEKLNG